MITALKKLGDDPVIITRFASTIGDFTSYHHGEMSLIFAI